jgi:hypothetical protein
VPRNLEEDAPFFDESLAAYNDKKGRMEDLISHVLKNHQQPIHPNITDQGQYVPINLE